MIESFLELKLLISSLLGSFLVCGGGISFSDIGSFRFESGTLFRLLDKGFSSI